MIKIGADQLDDIYPSKLKGRKIALITGSSNTDSFGNPVFLKLKKILKNEIESIWSLQHGFFVDKQDNMVFSDSFYWKEFDISIRSLYGESLLPRVEWLGNIDTILVDIFDVGTRVYTFVNHIVKIIRFIEGMDIKIIILDRPNILGDIIEGNIAEQEFFSIVGEIPVPMRHGFTVGEYVLFAKNYYNLDTEVEVIGVENWKRELFAPLWTYPSPNMPTYNTAIVYPGGVMLEGTNISEGRGTTRPFEFIGAPFLNAYQLSEAMKKFGFEGVNFIPIFFKPEFSKFTNEVCNGIYINITDKTVFRSFMVYYEIIRFIYNEYQENFKWKEPPYEYEYEKMPIDMINGSSIIRKSIENNKSFSSIEEQFVLKDFLNLRKEFLLY